MKKAVALILACGMILVGMAGVDTARAEDGIPGCDAIGTGDGLSGYELAVSHPVMGTLYARQDDREGNPSDTAGKRSVRAGYTLEDLGGLMDEQMGNYLSGTGSPAAQVENLTSDERKKVGTDLKSRITFPLLDYRIPYEAKHVLQYVYEAIGKYPNLCTLYTQIATGYTTNNRITDIIVYSPIAAEEMGAKTSRYKRKLDALTAVPGRDTAMSDMEKLLYVHDEIVIRAAYDTAHMDEAITHIPVALLLEGRGVCQAYAGVLNQAATALGMDSFQVASDTHAWNAVRLDGKWYYLDATFDDPVGSTERDYVSHKYFLFNMEEIKNETNVYNTHMLDAINKEFYGDIPANMGDAYRDIFIREVQGQMSYLDGSWYYAKGREIYCWDGKGADGTVVPSIPAADNRACAVCEGKLYVGGSDGVSVREDGEWHSVTDASVSKMAVINGVLNYKTSEGWLTRVLVEEEPEPTPSQGVAPTKVPSPSPTPGQTQAPAQTAKPQAAGVAPGRVTIASIANKKKLSLYFKIKKVKKATGYQYAYSTDKKFKKGKTGTTKKLTVTIRKLKKKKTYYLRVRAYSVVDRKKYYGKWSKVKKVKIKK